MPSARYLEVNLLLPLQQDLAVIEAAREEHQPVKLDNLLLGESLIRFFAARGFRGSFRLFGRRSGFGLGCHGSSWESATLYCKSCSISGAGNSTGKILKNDQDQPADSRRADQAADLRP